MDEAFLDFNTAIKLAPTYSMAYFGRANAFGRLSKLDDGIADLTQAILLNPRELQYYRFRYLFFFLFY
jgi:tetratricopeptide (TPR) repeat protein